MVHPVSEVNTESPYPADEDAAAEEYSLSDAPTWAKDLIMAFKFKGGKGEGKGWWGKGKGKGDKGDGKGKGKDGKGKGNEKGKGKGIQGNCWGCGKKGHRQSECRTHPSVAPVDGVRRRGPPLGRRRSLRWLGGAATAAR